MPYYPRQKTSYAHQDADWNNFSFVTGGDLE